jgi:hypothetical protein
LNDTIESYGSARQATSDDYEVYVNQEHFRREKNAFCLAKSALKAEAKKKKEEEEDIWDFPFPKNPRK